jgi:hypothetical protein
MAAFTVDKPIPTRTPTITVDAGLAVGDHRFQLEVVDDGGLRSKPDLVTVTVQRRVIVSPERPTRPVPTPVPPVTPVRPVVSPIITTPTPVSPRRTPS